MKDLVIATRSTLVLWVLTALIYPLLILLFGQVLFPYQANGSLVTNAAGEVVGSALIGQTFTEPDYFWSRPSAINYSQGEQAIPTGQSGASNLAPSNPELRDRIDAEVQRLGEEGVEKLTAEMLYSSGSGLDPHISPDMAFSQIPRIAQARQISPDQLTRLVNDAIAGPFLGIFGEPTVNVLSLNLALDENANR